MSLQGIAALHGRRYHVNSFYPHLPAGQRFIDYARQSAGQRRPAFVEITTSLQLLYSSLDIVLRALGGPGTHGAFSCSAPLPLPEPEGQEPWPFRSLQGRIAGVPFVLHLQTYLDPAEPSIQDMTQLVRQLVDAIRPYTDKPWALLGCSLGCKAAFEVARALASEGRHAQLLFLMACPAPSLPIQRKVSDYSEEDFAAEVRHLGGTPEQILADEQMMRTLTPILRNDSALSEGYCVAADTTLAVPMVMIAASDDHLVTLEAARRWKRHAAAGFDWRLVYGGHFFLRQQRTQLLGWLSEALQHPPR